MDLDKEIKRAIESAKQVTRKDLEEAINYYEENFNEDDIYDIVTKEKVLVSVDEIIEFILNRGEQPSDYTINDLLEYLNSKKEN